MVKLQPSAERIDRLLSQMGYQGRVQEMPDSTRTAEDAASAIGTTVAQIGKSLVFRNEETGQPVLVVASGINRVDVSKVALLEGAKIKRADADYVRAMTGFAIGGVPPLGHVQAPSVYLDADLFEFETIWCAAGTPKSVFRLTPSELTRITGAVAADIKVD